MAERVTSGGSGWRADRGAWYIVGIVTVGWIIAYMDRQIIGVLMESLRADLNLSDTEVSILQGAAFAVFFVAAGIPLGWLVDRGNRRRILFFGVLLWSLATMACGLAQSYRELLLARMLVGVGEACLGPATLSIVGDIIAPRRRGLAMGIVLSGTSLGSAASILLGGLILQGWSDGAFADIPWLATLRPWQITFFAVGLPGLLFSGLLLTFREPERIERAVGAAGRSVLKYLGKHSKTFGFVFAAFAANAIIGYTGSAWIAVILLRVHHMEPGTLGIVMAATFVSASLVGTIAAGLFGDWQMRRSPRDGRLSVARIILPLQAAVMAIWAMTDSIPATIAVFALSGPVLSAMTSASCFPALNQITPNELRGQTIACFTLISNLAGMAIAPTAVALITDYVLRDPMAIKSAVIMIIVPVALLGALCAQLAVKPFRRTVSAASWATA